MNSGMDLFINRNKNRVKKYGDVQLEQFTTLGPQTVGNTTGKAFE